jgi:hypothetical protein
MPRHIVCLTFDFDARRHAGAVGSDVGLMRSHVDAARRNGGHAGNGSEGVRVRGCKNFGEQPRSSPAHSHRVDVEEACLRAKEWERQ